MWCFCADDPCEKTKSVHAFDDGNITSKYVGLGT